MAERLRQRSAKPSTPVRIRFRPQIKRKNFKQCFRALPFYFYLNNPLVFNSFGFMIRLIVFFLLLWCSPCYSQCDGRYLEEIFSDVSVNTVTYSSVYGLELDVYQAVGDEEGERPLIILAHGGSFIAGSRSDAFIVSTANKLAKMGYVVAAISYRLMSVIDLLVPSSTIDGVVKAIGDGKAAVRYFRKSVEEGNPYRLDSDKIYFAGNSAGAIIALHVGLLQEEEILDQELLGALSNNGGFEGGSGNTGFDSNVKGVISLAGGIIDVNYISEHDNNAAIITCHGNEDNTVDYMCGEPLGGVVSIDLCGGGAILEHTANIGFQNHNHLLFEGADHVPWSQGATDFSLMINFIVENLYADLGCVDLSQQPLFNVGKVEVFPNPTESSFEVRGLKVGDKFGVYDLSGRAIQTKNDESKVDVGFLKKGVYLLKVVNEKSEQVIIIKIIKL